jgi:hypothetical protein
VDCGAEVSVSEATRIERGTSNRHGIRHVRQITDAPHDDVSYNKNYNGNSMDEKSAGSDNALSKA